MSLPVKCDVCGIEYDEQNNIGSWQCGQHVEPLNPVTKIYPCCGQRYRIQPHYLSIGCIPADHNPMREVPYTAFHDVTISEEQVETIPGLKSEAWFKNDTNGFFRSVKIRRFKDPCLGYHTN